MGRGREDNLKVCKECGSYYFNLCLHCVKAGMEERVWELMDRFGLNEEELIKVLADHIKDGKFAALSLAIAMREMKPADRHEVDVTEGKKISEARDGIHTLLSRLSGRRRSE